MKKLEDLERCDALILPGGESTTHQRLISPEFWNALQDFCKTKPVFGTCCGLILLSKGVEEEGMRTLGAIDVIVARNAYGSQIDSFETTVELDLGFIRPKIKGCFIRAPQIQKVSGSVKILAMYNNKPVVVQQGLALACSFHPEVLLDTKLHEYFVRLKAPSSDS